LKKNIAIIPARGGSKRVPLKNIKIFNGIPLILWTIVEVLKSDFIDEYVVSTDDQRIINVLSLFNLNYLIRDESISTDMSTSDEVLESVLKNANYGSYDLVSFVQCTSPFDDQFVYDHVIDTFSKQLDKFDNAFAASPFKGWLWYMDEKANGIGLNHDKSIRLRSQDMKWSNYLERGSIVVFKRHQFMKKPYRFNGNTLIVPIDDKPIVDIDTEMDFKVSSLYFKEYRSTKRSMSRIKVVISDFDGVFSNNKVYTDSSGNENIDSSKYDSIILKHLRKFVRFTVLTSEKNTSVSQRLTKLNLEFHSGIEDKVKWIKKFKEDNGYQWEEIAYIGNDINDLISGLMCGYAICPCDANHYLMSAFDEVIPIRGGEGVIRYFFEKYFNERIK